MLFYKIEKELWSPMKTFILFLNRLPEYPKCYIHNVRIDDYCMDQLKSISNEKN
jgi:hypothetical protein